MAVVDQSLLPQIHALFSDPLRVVSYKWLSRNFSVSSNDAKRLLQDFVNKHGTDLQVIYSVSGWLKSNPQNYCVKLISGPKLEEARQIFKDSCSVQIYSIQACIPKDTAVLWNPEFVQAEELFNQPFDYENCLRDNRFCGVLNSFVKRTSNGKHVSSLPPKPLNSAAAAAQSKPSVTPKEQFVTARRQDLPVSSKQGADTKSEKDNSTVLDKAGNGPVVKEQSVDAHASKSKAQNGKAMPSNGGSLANMWGRASAKPKPPSTTNSTAVASVAATADAQICAKEEADGNSSDDEHGIKYKRGSTNANNRKRRAVFDYSDDEEDDNIAQGLCTQLVPTLALCGILVYYAAYSVGMGPVPWVIMSEIFSIDMKAIAGGFVTLASWIGSFAISYSFNFLMDWNPAGTFFLFSAASLVTVLFVAKLVPETKGRTLEEIQTLLKAT